MDLLTQKCVPCEGGIAPMTKTDAHSMRDFHVKDWEILDQGKKIAKKFTFKNFAEALDFVNKVGAIAEEEQHHPHIHLTEYRLVTIELSTHAIGGLSQNDFIVAAKINTL